MPAKGLINRMRALITLHVDNLVENVKGVLTACWVSIFGKNKDTPVGTGDDYPDFDRKVYPTYAGYRHPPTPGVRTLQQRRRWMIYSGSNKNSSASCSRSIKIRPGRRKRFAPDLCVKLIQVADSLCVNIDGDCIQITSIAPRYRNETLR